MSISNSKQKDMILHDNLWKVMVKLSVPAVIAMVLYGLNTIFDAIFVGNFVGEVALSGVSLAYPLTQINLGIGAMIGGGAAAYLSIVIGENNYEEQEKILGNVNRLVIIIGLIYSILCYFLATPMVSVMGGTGEILVQGAAYFRVTAVGSIFWIAGLSYNMMIRGEGKMGVAAFMMGIGLLINIVTNYILIAIFDMGVVGAAWGTNLGMTVYTIFAIIYYSKGKSNFKANFFCFRKDKTINKRIISMGMPQLIMSVMSIIQGAIILSTISKIGDSYDIAFYGVVFRIYMFTMTPLIALMRSLQPTVGINYGAGNYKRAISATKIYIFGSFVLMIPLWLASMVAPSSVINLMLVGEVSQNNIFNFRIFMSVIPLLAIVMNGLSYFPSINEGKTASMIVIARQVVLYIPAMIILPRLFGIPSIYIGSFVIDVSLTLVVVGLLGRSFSRLKHLSKNEIELIQSQQIRMVNK